MEGMTAGYEREGFVCEGVFVRVKVGALM